jgi:phage gp29-like protein
MNLSLREFAVRQKEFLFAFMKYIPDPDVIIGNNYDEYRKLLTDPHLYAVVQQRKGQISQLGWELQNYTSEDSNYNLIMDILNSLSFGKLVNEVLNALLLGYSVLEVIWEKRSGVYYPIDLVEKPQEWFAFDERNQLIYHRGAGVSKLPDYKFILAQNDASYKNPYGEKLLAKVYWYVKQKEIAVGMWQKLAERYGMPSLVGRYPTTATEQEQQQLLDNLLKMIDDNITVLSETDQIDFVESMKYNVGETFDKLMSFYNREISKAILTVTLTTEVGKAGSYKAADIHKQMLEHLGLHDKKIVERAVNDMLRYFVEVNYSGKMEYPKVKLVKKETIVYGSVERDERLRKMGVKFSKDYYMKKYNLSEGDFEV